MNAIFKFELKGVLGVALVMMGVVTVPILGHEVAGFWVHPEREQFEMLYAIWLFPAFVAGFASLAWEQWSKTREYLAHRGVEPERLLAGRVAIGLAVVTAWVLVSLFVPFLWARLATSSGALASTWRLGNYLVVSLVVYSAFALGAFVGSLRVRPAAVVVLGGMGVAALRWWGLGMMLPGRDGWAASIGSHVFFHAAAVAIFLPAARGNFLRANDPDRPLPLGILRLQAVAGAVIVVAFGLLCVPYLQREMSERVLASYPVIARVGDEVGLWGRVGYEDARWFDAEHVATSRSAPIEPDAEWRAWQGVREETRSRREQQNPDRVWPRLRLALGAFLDPIGFSGHERVYLARPEGTVHVAQYARREETRGGVTVEIPDSREASYRILQKPGGGTFGEETEALGVGGPLGAKKGRVYLGDPEEGLVWSLQFDEPDAELEALPLPGGDRYLAWAMDRSSEDFRWGDGTPDQFRVRGERGWYQRNGEAWVESVAPASSEEESWVSLQSRLAPLEFSVEARAPDGTSLTHSYEPRTTGARLRVAALAWLAAVRPPAALLAGYFGPPPSDPAAPRYGARGLRDAGVAGGVGAKTLLLSLGLTIGFGLGLVRRGRARGYTRRRTVLWLGVLVAGGWTTALLWEIFEPDSAYVPLPRKTAERAAPALMIQSTRPA